LLRARCAACGTPLPAREDQDYWLGAYLLNFIVTEMVFAVLLLVVLVANLAASAVEPHPLGGPRR